MKEVIIVFPICLEELFFEHLEEIKNEKSNGYHMVSVKKRKKEVFVKITCSFINGGKAKNGAFTFIIPVYFLENKTINKKKFFQKGLCKIQGISLHGKILVFEGIYHKDELCLQGSIQEYIQPSIGWE